MNSTETRTRPTARAGALHALLFLLGGLSLAGCDGGEPDHRAAGGEPIPMRVAAITAVGTPWHDMWVRFEERLEAKALPEVDLQMYVTGQLGSEEKTLSDLRRGRVQVGGFSLQGMASVVPELGVILAPFLFESRAEVDFVMDEYLAERFAALFAEKGLHFVQWAEVGWTSIYADRPLLTPEDASGVPFRTAPAEGARVFGEALATDLVSLPFPEVVPSLQTGLIEAGQSGIGMYALTGIAREARHLTLTQHAFDTGVVAANQRWWNGLPEHVRIAFRDALDSVDDSRADVRRVLARIRNEQFPRLGVTAHELTPEQRAAWREATAGSHEVLIEMIGGRAQAVYDAIQEGKAAFARRP